ncbi:MAG: hypothetical protein ACI9TH_004021 [Kiritimatiellia bacterium]|jgi:hypothetical protein
MGEFGISIVSGVVGGLLTSLFLFLSAIVCRDRFIPWIEDRVYGGIRVDGTWCIQDQTDDQGHSLYSQEETLELEQKASRLSGRLILIPKGGEDGKPRTLKVEGTIRDRFVMLSCVPATRRHLGYQAFLGEISGDGTQLVGQASYYHISEAKVEAVEAIYTRRDGS